MLYCVVLCCGVLCCIFVFRARMEGMGREGVGGGGKKEGGGRVMKA